MLRDLVITLDKSICACHIKTGKYDYSWNMVCDEKSILVLVIHCKTCRATETFNKDVIKAKIVVVKEVNEKNLKETIDATKKRLDAIDKAITGTKAVKKKFDKPN